MRVRKNAVCVCLLLVPVSFFMAGIVTYHLDKRIVRVFEPQKLSELSTPSHLDKPVHSRSMQVLRQDLKLMSEKIPTKKPEAPKRYHVLINSYMNSGSRFTAGLFGFRNDSFYFYEPLWRIGLWDYFHRPNEVCSSTIFKPNCIKRSAEEVNIYRERGRIFKGISNATQYKTPIEMMTDILDKIYHCQLAGLSNMIVQGVQDDYGGRGWLQYKRCVKGRIPKHKCIENQEKKCKDAQHIVTKVLRLTTDSLEELLVRNNNIKIIHLFRDPRAIVNSRLESKGYPARDAISNARTLCQKMALDYEGGLRLMQKFPNRFKFAFYEDIKTDVKRKIQTLYDFVGMKFDAPEFERLNQVKTNDAINKSPQMKQSRSNDNSKWWRQYLSFTKYKTIEDLCNNVVIKFNLTRFKTRQDLIDMKIPSMNLPYVLKV